MRTSSRVKILLESLDRKDAKRLKPFMKDFERSCILSDFEDAIKILPFDVSEIKEELLIIFNHVRQRVIARLGERLLVDAVHSKNSSISSSTKIMERIAPVENQLAGALQNQPFIALIGSAHSENKRNVIDVTPERYDG